MDEDNDMTRKYILVLISIGICLDIVAAENRELSTSQLKKKISTAITNFEQTPRKKWAHQINRFENEEGDITSSIERFTPNLQSNKQWQLIKSNGEKPTVRQQKKFIKNKMKQANKKGEDTSYAMSFREIINQKSVQFILDNGSHIEASFVVDIEQLGEDAQGKLQGTLFYNKEFEFIEEVIVVNTAEFSPMFSANISELTLTFNFINIDGAVLPQQTKMQMKGRFAYFTEIDEVSTDTYSNYEYVRCIGEVTCQNNEID